MHRNGKYNFIAAPYNLGTASFKKVSGPPLASLSSHTAKLFS
jgi:hypothetical protein